MIQFLELDAVIKWLLTVAALGNEVKADIADVLGGVEVLGGIDGLALDFKFQTTQVVQTDNLSVLEIVAESILQFAEHRQHVGTLQRAVLLNLGGNLFGVNHSCVEGTGYILAC